jgi:glycine/D-amino acid oxidase-like deaminating enzyme
MKVAIVGAGVIGLATARALALQGGHSVTVFDRAPGPGQEASDANGALLHPSSVEPWNSPGILGVLWRSLGREDSAMLLRWRTLPSLVGWGLRFVRERAALPVVADESCVVAADIPRLAGAVDGVNIKLAKCGSLREALRMIAVARAHDLRVMCGCMIETTLGIASAAQLAPLLDDADLDGAALLADDPFAGPAMVNGRLDLGDAPGLGVTRRGGDPVRG